MTYRASPLDRKLSLIIGVGYKWVIFGLKVATVFFIHFTFSQHEMTIFFYLVSEKKSKIFSGFGVYSHFFQGRQFVFPKIST